MSRLHVTSYEVLCKISVRHKTSYCHGASSAPKLYETIGQRLRKNAEESPGEEFLVFRHQNVRKTYEQTYLDARRLACGLLSLGVKRGDRVGIWGPNYYEWACTQLATSMAGIVQVNVNPAYQAPELCYALDKAGVKALITPTHYRRANYLSTFHEVFPHHKVEAVEGVGKVTHPEGIISPLEHVIVFGDPNRVKGAWQFDELLAAGGSNEKKQLEEIEKHLSPDDPINIQFTSGTTGNPKAATLTHFNILNNAYFTGRRSNFHEEKHSICIPNPLYHCFGNVIGLTAGIVHRQRCVFPGPSFLAKDSLEGIHHERCTFVYGTPTMFIDMLDHPDRRKYDLTSLRGGYISGAPCPKALCERLVHELNMKDLCVLYGSTELSPAATMSFLDHSPFERIKNCGYPLDHTELSIFDPTTQQPVERGQRGELVVRGYAVFRGYWNDEGQTRKVICPAGWYHTGDTAIMQDDGAINVVGRTKEMIVRGGENIYPAEIEQFLHRLPYVADAHIVGVPDERLGEAVCAWIRLRDGEEKNVNVERIREDCTGKMAHYKVPQYILIKKEHDFPMTATGKVKKFELKELSKVELGLTAVKSHFNE